MKIKGIWTMIRETFQKWGEDKAPRLAAALSYYTIFSLAPLLVLIIAIAGFVVGNNQAIRQQILTQVQTTVGSQASGAVDQLITNSSKPRSGIIATVIGIVTLLLGATGVFGQLQDSLNTIWNVQARTTRGILGVLKDRFLSFAMVLGIAFLLLVSLVISTALSVVNRYFSGLLGGMGFVAQIVNIVISLGVITLIFGLIFKVLPDVKIAWRDVWIGALVTAVLFTIGKSLLSLYLSSGAASSAYGAAGSLVILLLWVYYSAQILFMGAEFTQVYARHTHLVIEPTENARLIPDSERADQGAAHRLQQATAASAAMPITGQPDIHPAPEPGKTRVQYEPPNPAVVVPVIAAGTLAGIFTITRIIRRIVS